MNKLLNRVGRSYSQQHLTNLEIDENEKLKILKLFGTKFIEKNSNYIPPVVQNILNEDQLEGILERRNSLAGIKICFKTPMYVLKFNTVSLINFHCTNL